MTRTIVAEVLVPLLRERAVSSGLVSKISKVLEKQVKKFHIRKIKDEYEYLILDGIFLNTKSPVWKKRRCILAVYGIKKSGKRELIDFEMAMKGESENAWGHILNRLYHRGLEGRDIRLVVIDGNKGLRNAVSLIYPEADIQRCWAHKLRNVANKVPKKVHIKLARYIMQQVMRKQWEHIRDGLKQGEMFARERLNVWKKT